MHLVKWMVFFMVGFLVGMSGHTLILAMCSGLLLRVLDSVPPKLSSMNQETTDSRHLSHLKFGIPRVNIYFLLEY